jgi:hypothetical protein
MATKEQVVGPSTSGGTNKRKTPPPPTAARVWTARAGHVRDSVVSYFAPGTDALRLLLSVLRPPAAATTPTTSIRTVLWFVTNYAAHHHVSYALKGGSSANAVRPQTTTPPLEEEEKEEADIPSNKRPRPDDEAAATEDSSSSSSKEETRLLGLAGTTKRAPLPLHPSGSARAAMQLGRGGVRPPFVVSTQFQNARDAIGDKLLFDPNCRQSYNLEIPDGSGGTLATSLGQLNFFKWAIQKEVIQYVIEHRAAISADQSAREERSGSSARSRSAIAATTVVATTDTAAPPSADTVPAAGSGGGARRRRRPVCALDRGGGKPMRLMTVGARG